MVGQAGAQQTSGGIERIQGGGFACRHAALLRLEHPDRQRQQRPDQDRRRDDDGDDRYEISETGRAELRRLARVEHQIGQQQVRSQQHEDPGTQRGETEEGVASVGVAAQHPVEPCPQDSADSGSQEEACEHDREHRCAVAQVEYAQPGQQNLVGQGDETDRERCDLQKTPPGILGGPGELSPAGGAGAG